MNIVPQKKRGSQFELSPIKAIELAASKIPDSVSLAQGIPSFNTPPAIRSFIQQKIEEGACDKYSLTIGLTELREEISQSMVADGLYYDPDREIVVTAGSIEGITAAMIASTSPGDEVLLPSPTYVSYLGSISMAGCTAKYVPLAEDSNFDFEIEAFERAITRKTRVLLYCSPNNPTGTLFSQEKTRALMELAIKHDLTVIIDEVYKDFYYTDLEHFSPVSIPEVRDRVIRVCSFSKAFAMTGWRVGFVHAASERIQQLLKYHDAMVTCAPVASQYGALAAIRYGLPFLEEFKNEFRQRRDKTIEWLDNHSEFFDYQLPLATYFVFPRVKDTVKLAHDSTSLAYDILKKAKVALVPGVAFGPSGESHLRINFGRDPSDLEIALQRLSTYFAGSSSKRFVRSESPAEKVINKPNLKARVLGWCARRYLRRGNATVIGIAGTRGKTVVKRLILDMLSRQYKVRGTLLSYNTSMGFPLSALGLHPPRSIRDWFNLSCSLLYRSFIKRPDDEILVLEYGINSKSDAEELLSIVNPDWLVLTGGSTHDPNQNQRGLMEGLECIASKPAAGRILWADTDSQLKGLPQEILSTAHGIDQLLENETMFCYGEAKLLVSRALVGKSAKRGAAAAALLASMLDIPLDRIKTFFQEDSPTLP